MVILAEKPSVAKDIAAAVGAAQEKGFYKNQDGDIVTYCLGHLFHLADPEFYDGKYKVWEKEDLPIIPDNFKYIPDEKKKAQISVVIGILRTHSKSKIIIATDADREGQVIAHEVFAAAGIDPTAMNVYRLWESESLTKEVIKAGLARARPNIDYIGMAEKGFAREHADWLVGMNFTRYVSCGQKELFTIGRVQTAILAEIERKNREIEAFSPSPYIEIEAEMSDGRNTVKGNLMNPVTADISWPAQDDYTAGAWRCIGLAPSALSVKKVTAESQPPQLYDITGLEKEANNRFDYSADKTLDIAQHLYENLKCLSYPRTSSRVLGDDNVGLFLEKYELLTKFYGIKPEIKNIVCTNKNLFDSKKMAADGDSHPGLFPLFPLPDTATPEEKNIYNLVLESFFTVVQDSHIEEQTNVIYKYEIGAAVYYIKSSVKKVTRQGWKKEKPEGAEEFDTSAAICRSMGCLNKMTTAPKHYTEASLLSFMENPKDEAANPQIKLAPLGTGATRADIIKKLYLHGYVAKSKRNLLVTEKGKYLIQMIDRDLPEIKAVKEIARTSHWEQSLAEQPAAFEKDIKDYIRQSIIPSREVKAYERKPIGLCPVCGSPVKEGKMSFYCSGYKDKSCDFKIWKKICGASITEHDAEKMLSGKKTSPKKMKSKNGKDFKAAFVLGKDGKINFVFDEDKR